MDSPYLEGAINETGENIILTRTTGPEAIWRNKSGMRANWRKNFEWLISWKDHNSTFLANISE